MRTIRLFVLPAGLAVLLVVAAVAVANNGGRGFDNKFEGTDGNDTFAGTPGKDLAIGKAGDDNLSGAAERDALFGGPGKDTLNGNEGDDWAFGGGDNDTVNGNDGNDKLGGGGGDDAIDGGPGDDVIVSAGFTKQRRSGGCDRRGRNFGGCSKPEGCNNTTRNMNCDKGRNFGRRRGEGRGRWRWVVDPQGKDTVNCGAGQDKVYADKDDVVNADCENVVRLEDKQGKRRR